MVVWSAIAATAVLQQPALNLSFKDGVFSLNGSGVAESASIRPKASKESSSFEFSRGQLSIVWDKKGLTTTRGKSKSTTSFGDVPTSPRFFDRDQIEAHARDIAAGAKQRGAAGISGYEVVGDALWLMMRWEDSGRTNWLETLVPAFDDPLVGAAGGPVFDVPLGRVEWKLCTCTRLGAPITDNPGPISRYLGPGADPVAYLAGCNMMFRRAALQQVDGFNPLLTGAYDDVDICCRLNDAGWGIDYLPDALVRHDRAPNVTRDGQQMIRVPYRILASRAIFALQSRTAPDETAVVTMLDECRREWHAFAGQQLAGGRLTPDEHLRFVEQADAGVRDGLAAGRGPRLVTVIPDPPRHLFRPYR